MKNLVLAGALIFSSLALGQNETVTPVDEVVGANDSIPKDESFIYDVVDQGADFPGGRKELISFLQTNVNYPAAAMKKKFSGKSYVKFVVSKTGEISNIKVIKGATDCPECDAEAVRVIGIMPNWIPGLVSEKPVNSYYVLPIVFAAR